LRKAEVFKKYGLDFCCGGKKTVKEACAEKGLDNVSFGSYGLVINRSR